MEPEEWERLAAQFASELGEELDRLETELRPGVPDQSFRPFWDRVKVLNERLRGAPAVTLDDKMAAQRRLNDLCQRARQQQKERIASREALERELRDALDLLAEGVAEAASVEAIQEIRADLAALRTRVQSHGRAIAQALWPRWQELNAAAWSRLNELWERNEQALSALLDSSEERLAAGDARGAKDAVKEFHAGITVHQCSHRGIQTLRERASQIWTRATEASKQRHEEYLQQAQKRLDYWKRMEERNVRVRADIEREIAGLEGEARAASTPVAVALLRGRLEERRKALHELDMEDRQLRRRIESAEASLTPPSPSESHHE